MHIVEEDQFLIRSMPFFFGGGMRSEVAYQSRLIGKIQEMFPDCFILKNNPADNQGIPDILILWRKHWAMLEVKLSARSPVQPNQPYYISMFDEMSFAAFIYPEIEEVVLRDLQSTLGARR